MPRFCVAEIRDGTHVDAGRKLVSSPTVKTRKAAPVLAWRAILENPDRTPAAPLVECPARPAGAPLPVLVAGPKFAPTAGRPAKCSPPHAPRVRAVLVATWRRSWWYFGRASPDTPDGGHGAPPAERRTGRVGQNVEKSRGYDS